MSISNKTRHSLPSESASGHVFISVNDIHCLQGQASLRSGMATNIASTELISESIFDSLRTPLLTEGQNDTLDDDRKKKGRSLTSPVVSTSSIDGVGNDLSRAFMGGYPEPVSPFVIMNQNAFDESGTVISPKKGFLRSVNTPSKHSPSLLCILHN